MATFTVGQDGKLLMDGKPIDNLWGSLGRNVTDVSTGDVGYWGNQPGAYDPRFYEQYDTGGSEGSSNVGYRLRPEVQQQLGGLIQLMKPGAGGYGEAMDPSQLTWDDQFGVLTKPTNIKEPDPGNLLERNPWMLALPAAWGALSSGGAFGGAESGAFDGAVAGGEVSGGGLPTIADAGNLSWTDIAAANPAMSAIPELGGGGLLSSIGAAISKNPLLAASLGMQLGGAASGLLGGNKPAGSSWSGGGGLLGGGLNIQDAVYKPNQQTERQLQELYGGNMGLESGGMPQQFGQPKPMQQQPYQMQPGGGQQQPWGSAPTMPGLNKMYGGEQRGYPSMGQNPMMNGRDFGKFQLDGSPGGAGNFGKFQLDGSPGGAGDFGPLPPPGTPQIPPGFMGGMPGTWGRPQITDQNINQSVRNSAIGDGYSGRRNGFLFAGGQRLMPITGSDAEDQATLRQFGVRPQSFGSQYGF